MCRWGSASDAAFGGCDTLSPRNTRIGFKSEAGRPAIMRRGVVKPIIVLLLEWALFGALRAPVSGTETQGKHHTGCPFANRNPSHAVSLNGPIVAADGPGVGVSACCRLGLDDREKEFTCNYRSHLALRLCTGPLLAWPADMHVISRAGPDPRLILFNVPAGSIFAAYPFTKEPNFGRGS
jgi:hypothetical protein